MRTIIPLALVALILTSCDRSNEEGATSPKWQGGDMFADGREYRWRAGGQMNQGDNIYRVLILEYYVPPEEGSVAPRDSVTYSSDPLPDMKGSATVLSAWPEGTNESGLVVNGVVQELGSGLNVAFLSNLVDPVRFDVPPENVDSFMEQLSKGDWDEFFSANVLPHVGEWPEQED
ncbi:hypothetical protein HAHE_14120 [Haloferula helveola]|uniref:Lipoprotein n=1 Tax=Haloferula helveola TaxID=490095 RepID=A0ABM7RIR6_9BACT|nr:hypothetical protein HAHE_14120 [Haloferula helveola]